MPRKSHKRPALTYEHFIFELGEWEPSYSVGVNHSKLNDDPYSEHVSIELRASCIFPAKLVGRAVVVRLWGDRQFLAPKIREYDKGWMPRCIGVLDMRPQRSEFNTSLPHDALWGLIATLPSGRLRYLLLYGYSLKRGQSLCQSIDFQQSVNLDDY
jgi:hypothetical protein